MDIGPADGVASILPCAYLVQTALNKGLLGAGRMQRKGRVVSLNGVSDSAQTQQEIGAGNMEPRPATELWIFCNALHQSLVRGRCISKFLAP